MRNLSTTVATLCMSAHPLAASAAMSDGAPPDLSYTYLEADYINLDIDALDDNQSVLEDFDDGNGWGVRGSFAFTPNFFGFADYSVTDSDATYVDENEVLLSSSQDVKRFDLGLGLAFAVSPPGVGDSAIAVSAAYTGIDIDDFNFGADAGTDIADLNDYSSDGYFIDARLRSQLVRWADASLGVRYTDIEKADNFSVVGNVLLEFTPNVGLNLEFDSGNDVSYYLVGLRYSFGR